jgi:hypothetical protein
VCACDLPWDPTTQRRAAMPAGPSPPAQGQVRPLRAPGHPPLPGGRPGALVAGGSRDLHGHLAAGAFRSSRGLPGPIPGPGSCRTGSGRT